MRQNLILDVTYLESVLCNVYRQNVKVFFIEEPKFNLELITEAYVQLQWHRKTCLPCTEEPSLA